MKKIYFLGPENSYSHIITKLVYGDRENLFSSCTTFEEVIKAVQNEKNAIGILPIENSITSSVHENIDAIFNNNLHIINEAYLQINLHLIGLTGTVFTDITDVYSHSKALKQSSKFIEENNLVAHEVSSTSAGKKKVLHEKNIHNAVIGSKDLVDTSTTMIKENIGNEKINITRFVCITSSNQSNIKNSNKATVIFYLPHIPGSLAKLLTKIAEEKINLVKIESRPIPGTQLEYQFLIDLEHENISQQMIETIFTNNSEKYNILGIYKSGKQFES